MKNIRLCSLGQNSSVANDRIISEECLHQQLEEYFLFLKANKSLASSNIHCKEMEDLFLQKFGFHLALQPSGVDASGFGVFLHGQASSGQLLGLYPGLVYFPSEPLFIPSIANQYIFRCADGLHIDGKRTGLSYYLFKSCYNRDGGNFLKPADIHWLVDRPMEVRNHLAIGQFVNNCTTQLAANVVYQEIDFSLNQNTRELRAFVPNLYRSGVRESIRIVALLAVRAISTQEELLSSYFTIINSHNAPSI